VLTAVIATPLVVGMGSRGADEAQVDALRVANETLLQENQSYREATGELTSQISSLQTALTELGEQGQLDPSTKRALDKLPLSIRSQAAGGPALADVKAAAPKPTASPEGTFGILRDILGSIENRLVSVRSRIQAQQALARATPSIWPITGGWTYSSPYGLRKDPFTGEPDFHPGIDISANVGVPVRATADGNVESASYDGAYGNAVVLAHGFTISTRYGHLSRYVVAPGQKVKRGEVIGYVGATGRVTSSHLHYEILFNGSRISPLTLLGGR
jgi:murein DD-endopeptidase MepM/ murein hydrolase activator NlpD